MIRLGIIVDGEAEYYSLPIFLPRMAGGYPIVHRPLFCPIQPMSKHLPQEALKIVNAAQSLIAKGANSILVLLDKETRRGCCAGHADEWSSCVRQQFARRGQSLEVNTVLKVTKYENWLISDPIAIAGLGHLFKKPSRLVQTVGHNRADQLDALKVLDSQSVSGSFHKKKGAVAICRKLDPLRAAQNSRSFRRFLRVAGLPRYLSQSRQA